MPAQKRPYVSPETAARLADLRRRMSATEGRTVTTDETVARLIDAAEGRITGAAELFEGPNGMQFTVSIGIPEVRIAGAADPEREARRAMIEYLEGLD
jgi:hypothetical protein